MNKILLLDKNYMALSIISCKKAMMLLVKNKAETMSNCLNYYIKTSNGSYAISSIVRLTVSVPYQAQHSRFKFNRKHVFIRDRQHCQYCNKKLGKNTATIDHIIPVSRGGKTSYDNCVACCVSCNNTKGDKTPSEIGYILARKPSKPNFLTICKHNIETVPNEWKDYVIGDF